MPRPLKRGILGASTIILCNDIDKYAFMCGSNFYETDVTCPSGSYDNCLTLSSQLICFLGYLIVSILTKLYFPYPVLLAVLLLCYVSMFF